MKKLQRLSLKKIKIANMNYIASLKGGETDTCMSTVCGTNTTILTYTNDSACVPTYADCTISNIPGGTCTQNTREETNYTCDASDHSIDTCAPSF